MKTNFLNFVKSSPTLRQLYSYLKSSLFVALFSYKTVILDFTKSNWLLSIILLILFVSWLFDKRRLRFYILQFKRKNRNIRHENATLTFTKNTIIKQKAINLILILAIIMITQITGNHAIKIDAAFGLTVFAIDYSLSIVAISRIFRLMIAGIWSLLCTLVFITNYPRFSDLSSILVIIGLAIGTPVIIFSLSYLYKFFSIKRIRLTKKLEIWLSKKLVIPSL
jgi:hypothetical protein